MIFWAVASSFLYSTEMPEEPNVLWIKANGFRERMENVALEERAV